MDFRILGKVQIILDSGFKTSVNTLPIGIFSKEDVFQNAEFISYKVKLVSLVFEKVTEKVKF